MKLQTRILSIGLLVAALSGMFVLYGADVGQETSAPYGVGDIAGSPESYVNEQVELSGDVIDTDPVRIRVIYDGGHREFVIKDAPEANEGQQLHLFGTLASPNTIEADRDRSFTRDPWEIQYMYLISILGATLVAARIGNEWRFNPRSFQFEPRNRTFLDRYRGDRDG